VYFKNIKVQAVSYIIIFGAAVKVYGEPSGAMIRRVASAILTSKGKSNAMFIVTGGIGKGKTTSEADVMKRLLINSEISKEQIIIEDESTDTLSSVANCVEIINARNDSKDVFVCSDIYHIPRCRLLFFLFGIHTKSSRVLSGLNANGFIKWIYYYIREIVAIPYDTILVYFHKIGIKKIK